jgi:hypothetical protein
VKITSEKAVGSKIEPVRATLRGSFDFIFFWVDVDTLFVRKDMDVRIAAQPEKDLHSVWHDHGPVRLAYQSTPLS